jgi:hypothetical protein
MGLRRLASILEVLGLLALAAGVGLVALWAGIATLGAVLVVIGIALERSLEAPPTEKGPT